MIKPLILLDFDGVIADSAPECFETSYETILSIGNKKELKEFLQVREVPKSYLKSVFIYYRGIVGPPEHFLTLLLLSKSLIDKKIDFKINHKDLIVEFNALNSEKKEYFPSFKKFFFEIRKRHIKKLDFFMNLNKPTNFTNKIIDNFSKEWPFYILSAKDENTIELWLDYYKIKVMGIFGNVILEKYNNSKYDVIKNFLFESKDNLIKGLFIDDFEKNLDPRFFNIGINTYYANWGYGINSDGVTIIDEDSAIKKIKEILK